MQYHFRDTYYPASYFRAKEVGAGLFSALSLIAIARVATGFLGLSFSASGADSFLSKLTFIGAIGC